MGGEQILNWYLNSTLIEKNSGANDVPMIKAAHVGIGISGQEGVQAVRFSFFLVICHLFLLSSFLVIFSCHIFFCYNRRKSKRFVMEMFKINHFFF